MSLAPKFSVGDVVSDKKDGHFYRVESVKAVYHYNMTRVFNPESWNSVYDVAERQLTPPRADELKEAENDYIRELAHDVEVTATKYAEAIKKFALHDEL